MRKYYPQKEDIVADAVLPLPKKEIDNIVHEFDTFKEECRDRQSERQWLTSDEL